MSEKRIIRRRRAGSTGSDSDEEVVLSGASQEDGVSYDENFLLNLILLYLLLNHVTWGKVNLTCFNNQVQVT